MKEITDVLTPEQQEVLRNIYYVSNNGICPFVADNAPTADTLKVLVGRNGSDGAVVCTAEDFLVDNDGDFHTKGNEVFPFIMREDVPEEVIQILDKSDNYELHLEAIGAAREDG